MNKLIPHTELDTTYMCFLNKLVELPHDYITYIGSLSGMMSGGLNIKCPAHYDYKEFAEKRHVPVRLHVHLIRNSDKVFISDAGIGAYVLHEKHQISSEDNEAYVVCNIDDIESNIEKIIDTTLKISDGERVI